MKIKPVPYVFGAPLETTVSILPLVFQGSDDKLVIWDGTPVADGNETSNGELTTEHACYPIKHDDQTRVRPSAVTHALHVGQTVLNDLAVALAGTKQKMTEKLIKQYLPYTTRGGRAAVGEGDVMTTLRREWKWWLLLASVEHFRRGDWSRAAEAGRIAVVFDPSDPLCFALELIATLDQVKRSNIIEDSTAVVFPTNPTRSHTLDTLYAIATDFLSKTP